MKIEELSQLDLIYYATQFDQEGSIGVYDGCGLRTAIGTSDHQFMLDFADLFGGNLSSFYGKNAVKEAWLYQPTGNKARFILETFYPYLIELREQAEYALIYQSLRTINVHFRLRSEIQTQMDYYRKKVKDSKKCVIPRKEEFLSQFINKISSFKHGTLVWLASLLDSDGSMSISRTPFNKSVHEYHHNCVMSVTTSSLPTIQALEQLFPTGNSNYEMSRGVNKVLHNWAITGNAAGLLARRILPYVKAKKKQCETIIEMSHLIGNKGSKGITLPNYEERDRLYFKMSDLNSSHPKNDFPFL